MNWNNITLGMYQQIEGINGRDLPEIDKVLYSTCIVFKKTEYQIDNEKPAKVVKMMAKMQSIFETPFNPRPDKRIGKYFINYDTSRITFGQYVELSHFIARGTINNAQFILATMANRWRRKHTTSDHRAKAEYFLTQPVEKVIGAVNVIQENYIKFNNEYQSLFGIDPNVAGKVQGEEFNKRFGWIYSATQVADYERITLDEAFALPVRQAFNGLIFLKAKGKYEMEQLRTSKKVF